MKINIHYIEADALPPNGNHNGLGIIVRNEMRVKLWGALSPVKGTTKVLALIWGTEVGILAVMSLSYHKITYKWVIEKSMIL